MITKDDVYTFFDNNSAIKISVIEEEAGITKGTINRTRGDSSRELNEKHLKALYPILQRYGFRQGLYNQRVIAIVNHKGGVAKTTTTANLGKALVLLGKKVLVIDMDPQGSLSQILGVDQPEEQVVHSLLEKKPLPIIEVSENFHLAPSDLELADADIELTQMMSGYNRLKKAIYPIRNNYDYILIDCQPSLNIFTNSALVAATGTLITLQPEVSSIKGLNSLFGRITHIQEEGNYELKVEGILFTLVDKRLTIHQELMKQMRDELTNFPVFDTYIRSNVAIKEAQASQQDIFEYDRNSYGAEDYMALAKELIMG